MTKNRILIGEAIDSFLFFVLFFGVFAPIAYLINAGLSSIVYSALMIIPATINFFLRRISRKLGVLLLVHSIIPIAIGIILLTRATTLLWVVIAMALALNSVVFAFRKLPTDRASFIAPCVVIFTFAAGWAFMVGQSHFLMLYPILLTITVLGRILLMRMLKMNMSLDAIETAYKQPIDKIITFDYKLTAGLVVAIPGVAFVIYMLLISPVIELIWQTAVPAIEITPPEIGERPIGAIPAAAPTEAEAHDLSFREPSRAWRLLTTVFFGVGSIGVIAGVCYGIFRLVLFILTRSASKYIEQTVETDIEDIREFVRPASTRRRRLHDVFVELHPIRRLFRDTAKKHIKMGVSIKKSDTPTDMAMRIQSEDISNLADEYAQVRYNS